MLLGKGKVKLSKAGKGKLILKPTTKGKHTLSKLKGKAAVHLTLSGTIRTLNGTPVVSKKQHVTLHAAKAKKEEGARRQVAPRAGRALRLTIDPRDAERVVRASGLQHEGVDQQGPTP